MEPECRQIELTIAISNDGGSSWLGEWAASLVESHDLDAGLESTIETVTGYGDTPLEAAAALLNRAISELRFKGVTSDNV